jgi:hypothetical protein
MSDPFIEGLHREAVSSRIRLRELETIDSPSDQAKYMIGFLKRTVAYYDREIRIYNQALERRNKKLAKKGAQ